MKVLAVLANDKKKSLNRFLFENITTHLTNKNYSVDVLDLYQRQKDIPFYVQPKAGPSVTDSALADFPFFQEHKKRFLAADMLIIVAPIYWYSVPGILKSWFELISNFAWKDAGNMHEKPLHNIKKAIMVTTMSMPWWYKVFITRNAIARQFQEIFKFIGIKDYSIYEITSVNKLDEPAVQAHLQKILHKI